LTREFLRELRRTDDAFQQTRLGEMAIAVETGNLLMEKAARIFDEYLIDKNELKTAKTLNYAGIFRTAIEQICQDVIILAERSIGSRGLMKPYHFERVIRDLKMYLRQAAPDAMLAGIGKYVLENEISSSKLWRAENE
jgi:alkylation response protein AidB-like acyl-CoA dehydrogenase